MGPVGDPVEVGMGSGARAAFEVCTEQEAAGALSGKTAGARVHTMYCECRPECRSAGDWENK